jgi:hypothetical protein
MARSKQPEKERPPSLTVGRASAAVQISERLEIGKELRARKVVNDSDLSALKQEYDKWSRYNRDLLTRIFDNDTYEREYTWSPGFGSVNLNPSLNDEVNRYHGYLDDEILRLESLLERLPFIPEPLTASVVQPQPRILSPEASRSVFIVHGHDAGSRDTVARFIEKLKLRPIILHEQPNKGQTVLEKFENNAMVGFAVVILTPDDLCVTDSTRAPRARQNVIFELGFFFGRLGRRNVVALYREGVEIPTDVAGLAYILLDQHQSWKMMLARELKASGLDVDLNLAI